MTCHELTYREIVEDMLYSDLDIDLSDVSDSSFWVLPENVESSLRQIVALKMNIEY